MSLLTHFRSIAGHAVLAAAVSLPLCLPGAAWAGPLSAFSFDGEGNVLVFDAQAGTGGWNGAITETVDPALPNPAPLSLAALVIFAFETASNVLTGGFEFTHAVDLGSSLFGTLSGRFTDPGYTLDTGGQFELDYQILGGTGLFAGFTGFGLSFLSFDPQAQSFNNYSEQGLLVADAAAVPEPASLWLAAAALGLSALALRRSATRPAKLSDRQLTH